VTPRFREAGILAEYIDGETPTEERDRLLTQLASGEIEVLINVGVLTEGWDSPPVSCIVITRPTKSLGLYRQMAGRGLRPALGKENLACDQRRALTGDRRELLSRSGRLVIDFLLLEHMSKGGQKNGKLKAPHRQR
jgi:superfamily II DNA or RNA helicase